MVELSAVNRTVVGSNPTEGANINTHNMITDNRQEFIESWLAEMPEGFGSIALYSSLKHNLEELIAKGAEPKTVSQNVWKVTVGSISFYWMGTTDTFDIIAEVEHKPQSLVINSVSKNNYLRGEPPYASQLYAAMLDDNPHSLLFSDSTLSQQGLNLWKNLVKQGYVVSVFDSQEPGKTRQTFSTPQELEKFYKLYEPSYRRYRYVLSKQGAQIMETIAHFNTRRLRELAGTL